MTTRPTIGVTTSARGGWRSFLANAFSIWRAGGRARRLYSGRYVDLKGLDGFVVGGGDDISAELYGGEIIPNVRLDPDRDRLELDVLTHADAQRKPVLGICRGAQMINVARGGTLHEDIYEIYQSAPKQRTILPRKSVDIVPDSHLYGVLGVDTCHVNALHHQSIDALGDGLRVAARDFHGIVQAVECVNGQALGVQWHPELLVFSSTQQALFRALRRAAEGQPALFSQNLAFSAR